MSFRIFPDMLSINHLHWYYTTHWSKSSGDCTHKSMYQNFWQWNSDSFIFHSWIIAYRKMRGLHKRVLSDSGGEQLEVAKFASQTLWPLGLTFITVLFGLPSPGARQQQGSRRPGSFNERVLL